MKELEKAIATMNFIVRGRKERIKKLRQRELNSDQRIFVDSEEELFKAVDVLIKETRKDIGARLGMMNPRAIDLEMTILGAAMFDPPCMARIRPFLKPEHFYEEKHREIFKAMLQVPVCDMRTVIIQLRKNGTIEMIGGTYYIAELTSSTVTSTANIEYHARVIIEFALRRELIGLNSNIMDLFDDQNDVFVGMEIIEKRINELKAWLI